MSAEVALRAAYEMLQEILDDRLAEFEAKQGDRVAKVEGSGFVVGMGKAMIERGRMAKDIQGLLNEVELVLEEVSRAESQDRDVSLALTEAGDDFEVTPTTIRAGCAFARARIRLLTRGGEAQAEAELVEAIRLWPVADYYFALGLLLEDDRKRKQDAIAAYRKASEIEPDSKAGREAYKAMRRLESAKGLFKR